MFLKSDKSSCLVDCTSDTGSLSNTADPNNKYCFFCPTDCTTCSDETHCSVCGNGKFLKSDSSRCVVSCEINDPSYYF